MKYSAAYLMTDKAHKLAEQIEDADNITAKRAAKYINRICDVIDDPDARVHLDPMMLTRLVRLAGSLQSEFGL